MLLFRSEEHVDRWCAQWQRARGGVMTLDQQWRLATGWYGEDRGASDWHRRSVDEAEELFRSIGLTSEFWKLR